MAKFSEPPPKILPTKPVIAPAALPAPIAAIAPDSAKVPLATCNKLVPSTSENPFNPLLNFSNAPPIKKVAAAKPAPIAVIANPKFAAPNSVAGFAIAVKPPANPFSPPPMPANIPPPPTPVFPKTFFAPPPPPPPFR